MKTIDLDQQRRSRKAKATKDATQWTVRDALQDMMDDLDSGRLTNVDAVLITYRRKENGREFFGTYGAGVNRLEAGGLLLEGINMTMSEDD